MSKLICEKSEVLKAMFSNKESTRKNARKWLEWRCINKTNWQRNRLNTRQAIHRLLKKVTRHRCN